jgi:hypothetical protein
MIRLFVTHPNAANILMVVLLVLGITSVGGYCSLDLSSSALGYYPRFSAVPWGIDL